MIDKEKKSAIYWFCFLATPILWAAFITLVYYIGFAVSFYFGVETPFLTFDQEIQNIADVFMHTVYGFVVLMTAVCLSVVAFFLVLAWMSSAKKLSMKVDKLFSERIRSA